MLTVNYLKQKLESGSAVIGTWCNIPSPEVIDVICSAGIDFVIIDGEHGPITFETAQQMIQTCESRKISALYRPGEINESEILRALDIGIHGLQVPNVGDVDDVKKIIRYAKYPPVGKRGFSPFTRAGDYSKNRSKEIIEKGNSNTLIGINIEDQAGIKNIDNILSFSEIDIIFIGLYDLSKSLNVPGDVENPKVQSKLFEITAKVNAKGKYAGTIATSEDEMKMYLDNGLKYIVYLVDCAVLKKAYEQPVTFFKKHI